MQLKALSLVIVVILLLSAVVTQALAQTPTPEWVNFYSANTTLNGQPVPVGSVVEAFDPDGVLCGRFVVTTPGSYGFMPCYLDDLNTPEDEGIRPGDTVHFTIDGLPAGSFTLPLEFSNGDVFEVDLAAVTPPVIPEPMTITLVGAGVAGLAGYALRRRRHTV